MVPYVKSSNCHKGAKTQSLTKSLRCLVPLGLSGKLWLNSDKNVQVSDTTGVK